MRVASLFGLDPATVGQWSGPQMMHALTMAGDAKPLWQWMPVAMADLCCMVAAAAGAKVSRADMLESWGWEGVRPKMTDDQLIDWMARHG